MEIQLTSKDKKRIEESILGKYAKVAISPKDLFKYPTGLPGLKALNYDPEIIQALPESVLDSYCGVGNPFTLGLISEGEAVLDIGCGAGVDAIVAAKMVSITGTVRGIDMVPEMLAQARENVRMTGLENVTFVEASAEKLPFPDAGFHVVISNGVFNLVPDKTRALAEAFRVLKSEGRLMIADQVLVGELPKKKKARIKSWFR
jgi:ubiquinone/menaquinone biosynthesis C-methylase UbiE